MKVRRIVFLCFGICGLTGLFVWGMNGRSSSQTEAQRADSPYPHEALEMSAAEGEKEEKMDVEPAIASEWVDAMSDDASHASLYEKAFEYVKRAVPQGLSLIVKNAMRLGDWVVIQVGVEDKTNGLGTSIVLPQHAYVVDMANGRVVGRDDWAKVAPLFEAIHRRAVTDDALRKPEFALNLARCSAAIAAENAEVHLSEEEKIEFESIPSPSILWNSRGLELTWFSVNSAVPPMVISYKLIYQNGRIVFHSEIMENRELQGFHSL